MSRTAKYRSFFAVGAWLCIIAASGCSGDGEKLVPAEGIVLIDGKPAANISVQFMPDVLQGGKGPTSFGTTDAEGKFKLQTNAGRLGAVPGPHKVTLTDDEDERPTQGQEAKKLPRLDPKYSTATGGLSIEVKGDGQPIKIELPRFRG